MFFKHKGNFLTLGRGFIINSLQFAGGGIIAALLVAQGGNAAEEERAVVSESVLAATAAQFGVKIGHILRQLRLPASLEMPSRRDGFLRHEADYRESQK